MHKIKLIYVNHNDNYSVTEIKEESEWFEVSDQDLFLIDSYINKNRYSGSYEIVRFLDHTKLVEKTLLLGKEDLARQESNRKKEEKKKKEAELKLKKTKEERDRKKYEELKKRFEDA